MPISCIVAEDEPKALALIQNYIIQVPFLKLKAACFDANDALEKVKIHQPDLLFLDINLPGLTGIELAAALPRSQAIIFTTAYSEYAVKGYEFNAIDYLLKPFTFERFLQAANKAYIALDNATHTDRGENSLFIKTGREIKQLDLSEVLYFEAAKEYITIHTPVTTHQIYKRMKELDISLPRNFVRIHQSYIINMNCIRKVENNMVLISNNILPVSPGYKELFFEKLRHRML